MTSDMTRRSFLKGLGSALVGATASLTGCKTEKKENEAEKAEKRTQETIKAFHTYVDTLTEEEVTKQLQALDDLDKRQHDSALDKLWAEGEEKNNEPREMTQDQKDNQALRKKLREAILTSTNNRADIAKQHWRNLYRTALTKKAESFSSSKTKTRNSEKSKGSKEVTATEMAQTMKTLMQQGR